ncbi:MAG TPA: hypothetical protein VEJ36_04385 [Nitrososphaerales archaeon]|nr:hypothetical protein [Nitrososphaerales archaeon]
MPMEVTSKEEFTKLLSSALEVRILADDESAKIKLRTKDRLVTYKTTTEEAESLTKDLKIPIIEL